MGNATKKMGCALSEEEKKAFSRDSKSSKEVKLTEDDIRDTTKTLCSDEFGMSDEEYDAYSKRAAAAFAEFEKDKDGKVNVQEEALKKVLIGEEGITEEFVMGEKILKRMDVVLQSVDIDKDGALSAAEFEMYYIVTAKEASKKIASSEAEAPAE